MLKNKTIELSGDTISTSMRLDRALLKSLKQACLDRETNQTQAVNDAITLWISGTPVAAAADPAEVTRTGPDQEAADALLAWWNSPEEDHVQAHLKRAIAAMLQIEHLLPGSLKGKKK